MTDAEREAMERKGLEEQKLKEALTEKQPDWHIFCYMGESQLTQEYWTSVVDQQFEQAAGDEQDRWTTLIKQFKLPQHFDVLEEFDGMNNE